jgi:lipopolysaccharide/colanic/teichoic acid biosynthesis glycosyltransferase
MASFRNTLYKIMLLLGDTLLFFVALLLAYNIRNQELSFVDEEFFRLIEAFSPLFVAVVIMYYVATLYEVPSILNNLERVKIIVRLNIVTLIIGLAYFYVFPYLSGVTPKLILLFQIIIFTTLVALWRVYSSHHIRTTKKKKAILIGTGNVHQELREFVNNNEQSAFVFVNHIEVHSPLLESSSLESLRLVLKENDISMLVVDVKNEKVIPLLPYFYNLVGEGVAIYDIHKMYEDIFKRTPLSTIGYFWFFEHVDLEKKFYLVAKRCVDIVLCIPVGIIFIISIPVVYILQKIENDGDGLFSIQKRWGVGGKVIKVYKYRTMLYTDEGKWRIEKGNQNRSTQLGKILNRTNIDELPQVINILKGEMSFIGPRNDMEALGDRLSKEIPYYMIRYSVQPGISGWAQITQQVEGQNPQTVEQNIARLEYDLFYIKHRSILLDVVIIARTFKTLFSRLMSKL